MKKIIMVLILITFFFTKLGFPQENISDSAKVIVENRIRMINERIKEKGFEWTAGITSRSYKTKEIQDRLAGLNLDVEEIEKSVEKGRKMYEEYKANKNKSLEKSQTIPNWIDYMSKIEDQETDGCYLGCWAYATTGVVQGLLHSYYGTNIDINLDEFDIANNAPCGSCNNAAEDLACGLDYMYNNKVKSENSNRPPNIYDNAYYSISSYSENTASISAIKSALQYSPVLAGMAYYSDFDDYTGGIYQQLSGINQGGHAVVIIGYNDINEYWICRNSFGADWGEVPPGGTQKGYFRIKYGECGIDVLSNITAAVTSSNCFAKIIPDFQTFVNAVNSPFASSEEVYALSSSTINSGQIATIPSGTKLYFKNNSSLSVYGTLNVNGTSSNNVVFDFVSPNVYTSNGIKVYSGGTANIDYAEIKNAKYGVYSNQGILDIDNSNIHDCTYGVYLYNTNNASSDPEIKNTYIEDNSQYGLYLYRASPFIKNNKIENNNNKGIYAFMYSDPEIVKNTIRYNSSYGVDGYYYSSLDLYNSSNRGKNLITNNSNGGLNLGYYTDSYTGSYYSPGYNSIYSNSSYEVAAYYGSNASVMTNYWGAPSPPSNEFYADGSSSYNNQFYNNYEYSGVGSSLAKSIYNEDDISLAYYNMSIGDYDNAEKILKEVLSGEFDKNKAIYALTGLNKCYRKANKKGLKDFLKQELKSKIKEELSSMYLELEAYWLAEEGDYKQAIKNYKKLQSDYKNVPEIVANAKLNEALIYLDNLCDKNKAEVILAELSSNVNSTEKADFLENCILDFDESNVYKKSQDVVFDKLNNDSEILPTDYKLFGNYPNPFNPSTTIKYSVPEVSNVSLTIYDMMGREIRTFENNGISAGQYSTIWDGTNSNGVRVSSGIYIYRFRAVSLSGNGKVFEKSNKLMMLK